MRWSHYFIPTLREDPADAEVVSHKLLLRAGMVRQLAAGIYSYLPLAYRVMQKIMAIIREEMNRIGGQEFLLPALNPREIWEESGRWTAMGDNMFRLRDRKGADLCLGMTHEEVFTAIARDELRSYRQLPQIWYQIQTKFRDEPRPKSGLLRVRQFIMKDSYSFDVDRAGLDRAYELHREAYCRIFDRCGLKYTVVEASSGAMGGSESSEFMVRTEAGEDMIVVCEACGYAANLEKATSRIAPIEDAPGPDAPEEFPTPGVRTIEDLTVFPGGAPADRQIKTLVYMMSAEDGPRPLLALLRGDHQLHETKLSDALGGVAVRPAHPDEIRDLLGASAGSLGGVRAKEIARARGRELRIVADLALRGRRNMTTGANRDDYHLRGVDVERDIAVDQWADLRIVNSGEGCPRCEGGTLEVFKALEVGHIFKLGTKYSESMGATVLTPEGKEVPIVMGSYGIGVERVMAAAIELHHDADGIIWPETIAPFDVIVTVTNIKDDRMREAGERLYAELRGAGFDVLLDDRDERAGVKFKDADLIGVPYRLTVGKKIADGAVEIFQRRTKRASEVRLSEAVARLRELKAQSRP
ncbi:proline--tRNA ligase [Pyrinomonas methylaliphatogenes]|jgi:prolyl-tRNA synthetase|uniref:Proline--tRNA ligase n=1 Tax=Pyrinomonas methylaliphatogenes TaxID=454194 RepID=A0A0B6WVU5_9BACT|nr:proline--tRNA ligase [Pyrinomonas methylaliphatogenes]MBX5479153.1 proline--tRNA ligase [Pyrinomonas methylaliphatogenes]CDM64404.1 prolyl-tRNA synthetase [Pyrinomonas methylaliphatogenes]